MIQAVTPKAIAEFATSLFNSKPSLAAYGDGTDQVDYDAVVARFKPGGSSRLGFRGRGGLFGAAAGSLWPHSSKR